MAGGRNDVEYRVGGLVFAVCVDGAAFALLPFRAGEDASGDFTYLIHGSAQGHGFILYRQDGNGRWRRAYG